MCPAAAHPASFRDPSGFVFRRDQVLYRQVNRSYQEDWTLLNGSGLLKQAIDYGWLVPHEVVDLRWALTAEAIACLKPQEVPYVSYPYEWSFSQLKDAALLTLELMELSMKYGMVLKDASAFNVAFHHAQPVFIDTLSFEKYVEGEPWVAYQQFCRHFLAPLALTHYLGPENLRLSQLHIDGGPLKLASKTLPFKTRFTPSLAMHIHLHAKGTEQVATTEEKVKAHVSKLGLESLLSSLKGAVQRLKWQPKGTQWADYYCDTNYSTEADDSKASIVRRFLAVTGQRQGQCWDIGANIGHYTRIAKEAGFDCVAFDIDPAAIDRLYSQAKANKEQGITPVVLDLTNPSPSIGWALTERDSFEKRGRCQVVMALALVHHLAIGNNVPLQRIAEFFSKLGSWLILEFVPKSDSQVKRLLASRKDIFPQYTLEGFEEAFAPHFDVIDRQPVADSDRVMFLLRCKTS